MDFSASSFIAICGYLVGAVGFLIYLLGTIKKGKNDIIRQDNIDLRASNQELRADNDNKTQIIQSQKDQIANLKDVATQTPAVNKLVDLITTQQKTQFEQHSQVISELSGVTKELATLAKAINKSHNGG